VAGSYDNEGIAIFALQITYYLWVKSVKTGSIFWAVLTALRFDLKETIFNRCFQLFQLLLHGVGMGRICVHYQFDSTTRARFDHHWTL
jgi:hypothetical protein